MLTQSLCFLFYFIWVFAYKRERQKKILQHFHAVRLRSQRRGKWGERGKIFTFHTFSIQRITFSYFIEGFLVTRLNWCRKFPLRDFFPLLGSFPWDFVICLSSHVFTRSPPKVSTFPIWNIDLLILKFDGKLSSLLLDISLQQVYCASFHRKMKWKCFYIMKNNTSPFFLRGVATGNGWKNWWIKNGVYLWWFFFYFTPEILCSLHIFSLSWTSATVKNDSNRVGERKERKFNKKTFKNPNVPHFTNNWH